MAKTKTAKRKTATHETAQDRVREAIRADIARANRREEAIQRDTRRLKRSIIRTYAGLESLKKMLSEIVADDPETPPAAGLEE